jgi:hypothetical protein
MVLQQSYRPEKQLHVLTDELSITQTMVATKKVFITIKYRL